MAGKTPISAEASDERVNLAIAKTKLECAEKIVQMYQSMLQAQGACGTPSCQTPGSGSSSVPTPVGNPFLNFFHLPDNHLPYTL